MIKNIETHVWRMTCLALFILLVACNDPTTIGAGIVDNDVIPIEVEEFAVQFTQQEGDPIVTYADGLNIINQAQVGVLDDDQFGRSEASFYLQMIPGDFFNDVIDVDSTVIDSVVLVLYLNESAAYGPEEEVTIAVTRLSEKIESETEYFSDDEFSTADVIVPSFTFTPDYTRLDTPTETGAVIRIPLPESIGMEYITKDTSVLNTGSDFTEEFNGFYIHPVGDFNSYIGFSPYLSSTEITNSGIRIYFHELGDTTASIYRITSFIGDSRSPSIQHYSYDRTGSAVEEALATGDDEFLFIQGNGGVRAEMTIEGLTDLGEVLINKAELFLPLAEDALAYSDYQEVPVLHMTELNLNGNLGFVEEFLQVGLFGLSPIGILDTVDGQVGYSYNLPFHTQELVDATIFSDIIRLENAYIATSETARTSIGPLNLSESSARSVIFGPSGLSEETRLIVSYTEEN